MDILSRQEVFDKATKDWNNIYAYIISDLLEVVEQRIIIIDYVSRCFDTRKILDYSEVLFMFKDNFKKVKFVAEFIPLIQKFLHNNSMYLSWKADGYDLRTDTYNSFYRRYGT